MNPEIHPLWPAISCIHVMLMGAPVFFVAHGKPACEDDSGWSFTCGQEGHPTAELMLVAIKEVVMRDAAVSEALLLPDGYCATRTDVAGEWLVEPL
jgi:hypothetical protein